MTIDELRKLWDEFSEIPVDNDDRIERPFHIFQCPNGLVNDLMGGKVP